MIEINSKYAVSIFALLASAILVSAGCIGSFGKSDEDNGNGATLPHVPKTYEANWDSLSTHPLPQWYDDAKFGIFIHWGPYSVPAWATAEDDPIMDNVSVAAPWLIAYHYAAWYWYYMTQPGSKTWQYHLQTYGYDFNYDDFIPMLTASEYNASEWIQLFKDAGAKYFVITTKHHDGFCLFPSEYTNRDSGEMGPYRDLIGPLVDAARNESDLKVGLYYSFFEWYNPAYTSPQLVSPTSTHLGIGPRNPYTQLPVDYTGYEPVSDYVADFMNPQYKEIVDKYDPDIMWADGAWDQPGEYWNSPELISYFYNYAEAAGKEVAVNNRYDSYLAYDYVNGLISGYAGADPIPRGEYGGFETPEYAQESDINENKWETCRGIGDAFEYNIQEKNDTDFMSEDELVDMLVDIVSKNGNLLLGIGPDATGKFVEPRMARLRAIGNWLKVNGEAIYGTRYYTTAEDGPNVRYTRNGSTLYAIALEWPGSALTLENATAVPGSEITLLGVEGALDWNMEGGKLVIKCPDRSEASCDYAYAFRITPPAD